MPLQFPVKLLVLFEEKLLACLLHPQELHELLFPLQKSRVRPGLLLPVLPKTFLGTTTTAAELPDFVNLFRQERPLILHSHRAEWDL